MLIKIIQNQSNIFLKIFFDVHQFNKSNKMLIIRTAIKKKGINIIAGKDIFLKRKQCNTILSLLQSLLNLRRAFCYHSFAPLELDFWCCKEDCFFTNPSLLQSWFLRILFFCFFYQSFAPLELDFCVLIIVSCCCIAINHAEQNSINVQ